MSTVYLSLGSNIDARANIVSGIEALETSFGTVGLSPVYRAAAVGFEGDDFINLVARIETSMTPVELKDFLTLLEDRHDRPVAGADRQQHAEGKDSSEQILARQRPDQAGI